MWTVRYLMNTPAITITPETAVAEAADLLVTHGISGMPVVDDDGRLLGMFSELDEIKQLEHNPKAQVAEYMTREVAAVTEDDDVKDVVQLFGEKSVHRLPVTRHGKVVGVIGCRDIVDVVRDTQKGFKGLASVRTAERRRTPTT